MRIERRLTHAEIRVIQRSDEIGADDPYLNDRRDHVPYRREREEHDAQTRVLIRQRLEMERLQHSDTVIGRLDKWTHLEQLGDAAAKQGFLEPLIWAVQRDPHQHEDKLVFLLIVCAPVARGVIREFVHIRSGLEVRHITGPHDWRQRDEVWRLQQIEQQQLTDVIHASMLDALYRYPSPPPDRFFPWLQATVAHGALDHLRRELPDLQTSSRTAAEAGAMQQALAGLSVFGEPRMRDAPNRAAWRQQIEMRSVFAVSDSYYEHGEVRKTCAAAVGRLAPKQRQVIQALFFEGADPNELARSRQVARSTIYNHKNQALRRLRDDEMFFTALCALGNVRDLARERELRRRYPDGRLPDGRRIVSIAS